MTEFTITKHGGLCDLQGFQSIISYLMSMRDGTYRVNIAQKKAKRSNRQNSWLWGVIYPNIRVALNAKGWEFTDDDQIHEFFKDRICRQSVVNKHTGSVIDFPDSTSDMDTIQFSTYCDRLIEIATEYLDVDIKSLLPDPKMMKALDDAIQKED